MSSDTITIRIRNLGKKYKLGDPQEKNHALCDGQFREGAVQEISAGSTF